ncbi:MAG: hypothetical protein ACYC7E_15435 [Armatimonadota bacterium]
MKTHMRYPVHSLIILLICCGLLMVAGTFSWGQTPTGAPSPAQEQQANVSEEATTYTNASKFTFGGYGEIHVNAVEGAGNAQADIHRAVLYVGYEFSDWIQLNSEVEIEHAFINDGNGEISLEQLYVDFLGSERLNTRAGRVLIPMGIINQRHEPTTFNGVERPLVDNVIIPSTWFAEGAGINGALSPLLKYEAYLSNSLDGSKFSALNGIRNGRMKERPGLSQLAVSGRLDFFPLANADLATPQNLRFGLSFFGGGVDNGNKGVNPNIDASVQMYAADAEYSIGRFDLRGVYAYGNINGAETISSTVASSIMGWYIEGGVHFLPDSWKKGKLRDADAVLFVRHERADTQHTMPAGGVKNLAGDRTQTTVGVSFFPVSNLVLKADYQFMDDATGGAVANQYNLGLGWTF